MICCILVDRGCPWLPSLCLLASYVSDTPSIGFTRPILFHTQYEGEAGSGLGFDEAFRLYMVFMTS